VSRYVRDRIVPPIDQIGKEIHHLVSVDLDLVKGHAQVVGELLGVITLVRSRSTWISYTERVHRVGVCPRGKRGHHTGIQTPTERDSHRNVGPNHKLRYFLQFPPDQERGIALSGFGRVHIPIAGLADRPRFDINHQHMGRIELSHALEGRPGLRNKLVVEIQIHPRLRGPNEREPGRNAAET